jgi:hypothetical protein
MAGSGEGEAPAGPWESSAEASPSPDGAWLSKPDHEPASTSAKS